MSELPPIADNSTAWSDAELALVTKAYMQMLHAELQGLGFNKAAVNRELRAGQLSSRTQGSIEFRMRNVSAALYELKMPYIAGYLPALNIGTAVKEKMIALLSVHGIESLEAYIPTPDSHSLANRVSELRQRHLGAVPKGTAAPAAITITTTTYIRDPAVKAWVLQTANGNCEGCGNFAPFKGTDGLPYLEVHHVMPMSSLGSDKTTNAVALCPNCHRRCHYSSDRDEFKLALYERNPRLNVEAPELADGTLLE